jgi:ankyrin repeat protein
MHHLAQALLAKERVLAKLDSYYYTELVKVKTRNRTGPIVWDPDVDWVTEWRFKAAEYNQDMAEPNRIIAEELAAFVKAEEVTQEVIKGNKQLQATNLEASKVKAANIEIEKQIEKEHERIKATIKYLNPQQKAHLMAEIISELGSDFIVSASEGFDLAALAYFAVQKEDSKLLGFVIAKDPSIFDSTIIEGKTLLQIAIHRNHPLLAKIINASADCINTLLTAVSSNDIAAIKAIGTHNPKLLELKVFDDMSLLQIAASNNLLEMSELLISLNPAMIKLENANGDSLAEVALRSASDATVKSLTKHLNVDAAKLSMNASLLQRAESLGLIEAEEATSLKAANQVGDQSLLGHDKTTIHVEGVV